MADFKFRYARTPDQLIDHWPIISKFLAQLRKKVPQLANDATLQELLIQSDKHFLSIVFLEDEPVGIQVLANVVEQFFARRVLVIFFTSINNAPGLLDACEAEVDRVAELVEADVIRWQTARPGLQKRLKIAQQKGYKAVSTVMEKSCG